MPSEDRNSAPVEYLVPCLLPDTVPGSAVIDWPPGLPHSITQWWRVLAFSSLPIGLFARVLSRLLHIPTARAKHCWKSGTIIQLNSSNSILLARVELLLVTGSTFKLSVKLRSPTKSDSGFLTQILHVIDSCIACFYVTISSTVQRSMACPHCIEEPYMFTYDDVISVLTKDANIVQCKGVDRHIVLISDIAPDLSMSGHAIIPRAHVTLEKQLGEGGFGRVWKAQWGEQTVAYKELKFDDEESKNSKFSELQREADIMVNLKSQFILRLFGVCLAPPAMILGCNV